MTDDDDSSPFTTPLPDDVYSTTEKAVIWTAISLGLAALAGLMLAYDTVSVSYTHLTLPTKRIV